MDNRSQAKHSPSSKTTEQNSSQLPQASEFVSVRTNSFSFSGFPNERLVLMSTPFLLVLQTGCCVRK